MMELLLLLFLCCRNENIKWKKLKVPILMEEFAMLKIGVILQLSIDCADSVSSSGAATETAAPTSGNELSAEPNLTVDEVPGLLGVLLGLRNLMPLTCNLSLASPDATFQLKGSFGAKVTETDVHIDIVLLLRVNCFDLYRIFLRNIKYCELCF